MYCSTRTWIAAVLSVTQLSCLAAPAQDGCLERRESILYLSKIRESIAAQWEKPPAAGGMVIVAARVTQEGKVRNAAVSVRTRSDAPCGPSLRCQMVEGPLRRSMEAAVRKARPIGPPPEAAACMLGQALVLTFETSEPYVQEPDVESPGRFA